MKALSVEVGRYGRLVLPKKLRDQYGIREGTRLIVTGLEDRITLLPVKSYDSPTQALYGSVRPDEPVDEPKQVAREHMRGRLTDQL